MSGSTKGGIDDFDEFCRLPDLRERIKKAGVLNRAEYAEVENNRLHEELFAQEERLMTITAEHDRQISLLIKVQEAAVPATLISRTQGSKKMSYRDGLDAVIESVLKDAHDHNDYQNVFAEMVKMAEPESRPVPFTGPATKTGIPYQRNNGNKDHFTPRALKGKLQRRAQSALKGKL